MRAVLPVLLLLSPPLHAAEELPVVPKKKALAVSMLPDGSQLQQVMFPRYDEMQRLVGVLKARTMTLIDDDTISGETVSIEFFNADHSPRGRADFAKALFYQARGLLETKEPVTLHTDRINARGSGLTYAFEQGEGFLSGPADTWIEAPPTPNAMNSSNHPLRSSMLAGLSLIASAAAAPPAALTTGEKAALQDDAASKSADHATAVAAARSNLIEDLTASAAATAKAKEFLERANLANAGSPAAAIPAATEPYAIEPGPADTLIRCDGGMYFDADEGVFVYLKNVRVTDPRFTLSGANELKIFLGKKPEEPAKKTPKADQKPKLGAGGKFGDVERILATGAVLLQQKSADGKDPIQASGAIFSYHLKSDQAIITGGYPWLLQKGACLRAKQPDLTIRLSPKSGTAVADPGDWETILNLEQFQKKP